MLTNSARDADGLPKPLQIVVDQPTEKLGLGYDKYVDALAQVAQNGVPARYTVGIYGAWGVGKSSILSALERALQNDDLPVVTFDAWRYARNPNVLVPLMHEINEVLNDKKGAFWKSIGRGLRAITAEMTVPTPIGSISGAAVGNAISGVSQSWREPVERRRAEVPHYQLREIGRDLTLDKKRIVVLVDDLDRCPPDTIVDVLEAIHVLTDVQGFVFVLALDYDVLTAAIRTQYPSVDAALFVEKIIQIPFWIPEADRSSSVINDVVPSWRTLLGLNDAESQTLEKVVHLALRTNPRQVKRLVNSMLVAQHILGESSTTATDKSVLLAVIGLQLRWPMEFKRMHLALAANPDNEYLGDFDSDLEFFSTVPGLSDYVNEVLPGDLSRVNLLAAMKYSQTTASASAQPTSDVEVDENPVSLPGGPQHEVAEAHAPWFEWVRRQLEEMGATHAPKQQYIVFKLGTRAFLRADGYARIGMRLFFPNSMTIDPDDLGYFAPATGGRAGNFEMTLVVNEDTQDLALKYMMRALKASPEWRRSVGTS
jgi:hypothetical protein